MFLVSTPSNSNISTTSTPSPKSAKRRVERIRSTRNAYDINDSIVYSTEKINGFLPRFISPKTEQQYQENFTTKWITWVRFMCTGPCALIVSFWVFKSVQDGGMQHYVRVGLSVLALLCCWLLFKCKITGTGPHYIEVIKTVIVVLVGWTTLQCDIHDHDGLMLMIALQSTPTPLLAASFRSALIIHSVSFIAFIIVSIVYNFWDQERIWGRNVLLTLSQIIFIAYARVKEVDSRHAFLAEMNTVASQKKCTKLLHTMLPSSIIKQMDAGDTYIYHRYKKVSVLFSKICKFDSFANTHSALEVIQMLNDLFTAFDNITTEHHVFKVETVGEVYLVSSGCPEEYRRKDHASILIRTGDAMIKALETQKDVFVREYNPRIEVKVGIHTGSVVAGVVGDRYPRYRLMGDTVNTSSRMCSTANTGKVQISSDTMEQLCETGEVDKFDFEQRGPIQVKGKGMMITNVLVRVRSPLSLNKEAAALKAEYMRSKNNKERDQFLPSATHVIDDSELSGPFLCSEPVSFNSSFPNSERVSFASENTRNKDTMELPGEMAGQSPYQLVKHANNDDGLQEGDDIESQIANRTNEMFSDIQLKRLKHQRSMERMNGSTFTRRTNALTRVSIVDAQVLAEPPPKNFTLNDVFKNDDPRFTGKLAFLNVIDTWDLRLTRFPELEAQFQDFYAKKMLFQLQCGTLAFIIVEAAFMTYTSFYYPQALIQSEVERVVSFLVHYLLAAPAILFILVMQWIPRFRPWFLRHSQGTVSFCFALIINSQIASRYFTDYPDSIYVAFIVIHLSIISLWCGTQFRYQLYCLSSVIIVWLALTYHLFLVIELLQWIVVVVAVVLLIAARAQETVQRRDFVSIVISKRDEGRAQMFLDKMLPPSVSQQLISNRSTYIAHDIPNASVLFCDVVSFTSLCATLDPLDTVALLNIMFSTMDALSKKHNVYKVETIGDCYFACTGVIYKGPLQTCNLINMALAFQVHVSYMESPNGDNIRLRIGIHTGPVLAGVTGKKMPRFHLFGETVTIAEEMEQNGIPEAVVISQSTKDALDKELGASGALSTSAAMEMLCTDDQKELYSYQDISPLESHDGQSSRKRYLVTWLGSGDIFNGLDDLDDLEASPFYNKEKRGSVVSVIEEFQRQRHSTEARGSRPSDPLAHNSDIRHSLLIAHGHDQGRRAIPLSKVFSLPHAMLDHVSERGSNDVEEVNELGLVKPLQTLHLETEPNVPRAGSFEASPNRRMLPPLEGPQLNEK